MMELGDIPGRSPIFRICRVGTSHQKIKKGGLSLRRFKCDPKTGLAKFALVTFYMRDGPLRKKSDL